MTSLKNYYDSPQLRLWSVNAQTLFCGSYDSSSTEKVIDAGNVGGEFGNE